MSPIFYYLTIGLFFMLVPLHANARNNRHMPHEMFVIVSLLVVVAWPLPLAYAIVVSLREFWRAFKNGWKEKR